MRGRKSIPKKIAGLGFGRRATPAQKARVIQELRPEIPLKMLLSVAHLSRSTFYDEIKRMKKGDKYASVKREIQAFFKEHQGRYGYRRITAELENRKIHCNQPFGRIASAQIGMKECRQTTAFLVEFC